MTIMSGGFGLSGNQEHLIAGLLRNGVRHITVISHNCGADGFGHCTLLNNGQIRKMIASYIGEIKLFAELYLVGNVDLRSEEHTCELPPLIRNSYAVFCMTKTTRI